MQFWLPDLRDPKVQADIRRQAKLMAQHPGNDAIDDWLDAIRDPSDFETRDVALVVLQGEMGKPPPEQSR